MKFKFINNHIILSVETDNGTKNCVFDTGSPFTFFFEPVQWFSLDGQRRSVSPNPLAAMLNMYRPRIESLIGIKIDGIIGTESFNGSNVLIDFKNQKLSVSSEELDASFDVPMENFFGLPIFKMVVNGEALEAAFDSGAMYSFVSSELVGCLKLSSQDKIIEDFNPMLGNFTAQLYKGEICIGQTRLGLNNIAASESYNTALQMMGVKAFLGTDALRDCVIGFSYPENRMGVQRP